MDELIVKLRLLVKAESILIRLHLRRTVRQVSLVLAAALFGLLALVMLNVALYLFLEPRTGPAQAALAAAGLDLLAAAAAVIIAGRLGLGPEAGSARSLRDLASAELAADADRLREQLNDLGKDIKRIRAAVTGITHPAGIGLPRMLQWLVMLIGLLRRKRG